MRSRSRGLPSVTRSAEALSASSQPPGAATFSPLSRAGLAAVSAAARRESRPCAQPMQCSAARARGGMPPPTVDDANEAVGGASASGEIPGAMALGMPASQEVEPVQEWVITEHFELSGSELEQLAYTVPTSSFSLEYFLHATTRRSGAGTDSCFDGLFGSECCSPTALRSGAEYPMRKLSAACADYNEVLDDMDKLTSTI